MSIIKRITKTYIIITALIIVAFVTMTRIYTKNYYRSESLRIKGISAGVNRELNYKFDKIRNEGEEFYKLIEIGNELVKKYNIDDVVNILFFKNKMNLNLVDSAFVLNENGEFISSNSNIKTESDVLREIVKSIKSEEDSYSEGFVAHNGSVYYTYNRSSKLNENKINFFLVKKLDEKFLAYDEKIDGREIVLSKNIDTEDKSTLSFSSDNNIFYSIKNKSVQSFIPLKIENGDDKYYITVNEVRKTLSSIDELSNTLIIIFILACCIGNYFIYKIIKHRVVNRIIKINEDVNKIVKNINEMELLEIDKSNDEISSLIGDINSLINRIKRNSDEIINKERKNARLLSSMSNAYIYLEFIEDENGQVIDAVIKEMNKSAMNILDINEEFIGKGLIDLRNSNLDKFYSEDTFETFNNIKYKGNSITYKNLNLTEELWVNINMTCVDDGYISIILNDVSELKNSRDELEKMVGYDEITGLYSRFYIMSHLKNLINLGEEFFTLFIDLDNFKLINDAIGHNRGDKILKITGDALSKLNDEKTVVGRYGGDEFIIVRRGNKEEVEEFAKETLRIINRRVRFNNYAYIVRASIGVSLYPKHADNVEQLIQYADIALYEGKSVGGNVFKLYSEEMLENYELQEKLNQGIERGELEVYYQPICNAISQEIIGAEALIRWRTAKEVITPDRFLDIAKRSGDIILIDDFVLREACKFGKERRKEGRRDFYVSVNMSYKYFMVDSFVDTVKSIIETSGINASSLRLEIAESEILRDYEEINKKLQELRSIGVKISLDDFGIGYSAFNYIRNLPIDAIKIDKSLVADIRKDGKSEYIIDTLIKLCKNLKLEVVCEGVEYKEQLDILKNISCKSIQGFYFSEPVKKERFIDILNQNRKAD